MAGLYTPRQVAQAFNVSESSVKRWCDDGRLPVEKTPGGHRRIQLLSILEFSKVHSMNLIEPEALGIPYTGASEDQRNQAYGSLIEALAQGDRETYTQLGLGLVLEGRPLAEVLDMGLGATFEAIGRHWSHGDLEVYQERLAVQIAAEFLLRVKMLYPCPEEDHPLAVGGTLSGDYYQLPTQAVEALLLSMDWNAFSFGTNLPGLTLAKAIENRRPRLVWVSISWIDSYSGMKMDLEHIRESARRVEAPVVVGGHGLSTQIENEFPEFQFLYNLRELQEFVAAQI